MERTLLMGYLTSIHGSFCNCNRGMDFWSSGDILKTELGNFHIPSPTISWKSACNFVLKSDIVWPHPGHLTRHLKVIWYHLVKVIWYHLSAGQRYIFSRRIERGTDSSFRPSRRKRGQDIKGQWEKLVSYHVWCETILIFSPLFLFLSLLLWMCTCVLMK